jgi:hypothetical protein
MIVNFDEGAIYDLLNGYDGPVWQLVNDLSEEAADLARTLVPIRHTPTWSARSNAQAIGATLASIHAQLGYDHEGHIYGGVNAIEIPSIFLEYPRVDRKPQPFLTTAVWSLEATLA